MSRAEFGGFLWRSWSRPEPSVGVSDDLSDGCVTSELPTTRKLTS